ncbi:MAG: chaperone NapD [Deltaproteobacteria bacterium]|nr:chaperone NapD [Deltaproteobacteria bacterium]
MKNEEILQTDSIPSPGEPEEKNGEEDVSISAVLVGIAPGKTEAVKQTFGELPWVEVHHQDDTGRMVVTIEGESTDQVIGRLRELKSAPSVLYAEMVTHYYREGENKAPEGPGVQSWKSLLDEESGEAGPSGYYQKLKKIGSP